MTIHLWEDNRITFLQMVEMTIALISATAIITVPLVTGIVAKHDGWMAPAVASLAGALTIAILSALGRRFPELTLPQYAERLLGVAGGKLVTLSYVIFFLSVGSVIMRESDDFLVTGFYPDMPPLLFGAMGVFLTSYMLWNGIENLGRTTLIVIPIQMSLTFLVTTGVFSQLQPELIRPLFERGWIPVVRAAFPVSTWFGEIVVLGFLYPLVHDRKGGKAALVGLGAALLLMIIVGLTVTMLFGDEIGEYTYPRESVGRFVTVGGFLRIDALSMAVWLFLRTIKVAIFQYVLTVSVAYLFELSDFKPLILPMGGLMLALSSGMYFDKPSVDTWLLTGAPVYAAVMQLGLPGLLLLIAWARGLGGGGRRMDGPSSHQSHQSTTEPSRGSNG